MKALSLICFKVMSASAVAMAINKVPLMAVAFVAAVAITFLFIFICELKAH